MKAFPPGRGFGRVFPRAVIGLSPAVFSTPTTESFEKHDCKNFLPAIPFLVPPHPCVSSSGFFSSSVEEKFVLKCSIHSRSFASSALSPKHTLNTNHRRHHLDHPQNARVEGPRHRQELHPHGHALTLPSSPGASISPVLFSKRCIRCVMR